MKDDEPVRGVFVRGKTVSVTFDMSAPDPREKRMRLTFFLRPDATPEMIAADLTAVCGRLSDAEIALGGKGLVEDGPRIERGGEYPCIRLVLRANAPTDSGERLKRLGEQLGYVTVPVAPTGLLASESFVEVIYELPPVQERRRSQLGQTEFAPVNILPAWEIDMSLRAGLKLTFRVTAGATAEAIAADLKAVHDRLNEYEISLGGKGLEHAARQPEPTATDRVIRWVLEATEPTGAADRLGQLVAALTPLDAVPSGLVAGRSLAGCVAELIA